VPLLVNQPKKTKTKEGEYSKGVQKKWVTQFPWVGLVVDPIGKIHMVHCKVCSMVESKKKIINPKLNGLQKHVRKKKALVPCLRVLVDDYYISNDNQCQINEKFHANWDQDYITKLVVNGRNAKKEKKLFNLSNFPFVKRVHS
jgi:hypothetical protein